MIVFLLSAVWKQNGSRFTLGNYNPPIYPPLFYHSLSFSAQQPLPSLLSFFLLFSPLLFLFTTVSPFSLFPLLSPLLYFSLTPVLSSSPTNTLSIHPHSSPPPSSIYSQHYSSTNHLRVTWPPPGHSLWPVAEVRSRGRLWVSQFFGVGSGMSSGSEGWHYNSKLFKTSRQEWQVKCQTT